MAAIYWKNPGASGNWNNVNNWSGTLPARIPNSTDDVTLGNDGQNYTVTIPVGYAAVANSLTISGRINGTKDTTLSLQGGSLTTTGTVKLSNAYSHISGYGTITAGGAGIVGNVLSEGTITATGGTLDLKADMASGPVLAIGTAAGSQLLIDGTVTSAAAISLTNDNQTLAVGSTGSLTIATSQTTTAGHIKLDGGTLTMSGNLTIGAGGLSGSGTIALGTNTLTGTGVIKATGGNLSIGTTATINGTSSAFTFQLDNGSTLALTGTGAVGTGTAPALTFLTTGQTSAETFQATAATFGTVHLGTITGFSSYDGTYAHSDKIQLKAYGAGDYIAISGSSVTIHNANNSASEVFNFASGTNVGAIHLTSDGSVNTLTICFLAGTMIRTPDGEAPIETLKPGDLVLTTDSVAKPVSWLGKQTVVRVFADPLRSWPICVKANALDENVPSRDLLVSPDHALLVEGALIQAGALVNGSSIVRVSEVPGIFVYYHVELDDHSLIFAENAPAETFVDNVDRMNFDNWAEHEALYPNGKTVEELPYPRAKAQRQVPVHVRVKLAERAQLIGAAEAAVA